MTTESGYYLQMKDDFGDKYTSPIFNITREHWQSLVFVFTEIIMRSIVLI